MNNYNQQTQVRLPEMTFERLRSDTKASGVSAACEIVSVLGFWMDASLITSVIGIILGIVAKHNNPNYKSLTLANRGLMWSIVGMIIKVIGFLVYVIVLAAIFETSYY